MNREPFRRAILANPSDDALRLIYADALDDAGEAERAEFIRVQIALASANERKLYVDAFCEIHSTPRERGAVRILPSELKPGNPGNIRDLLLSADNTRVEKFGEGKKAVSLTQYQRLKASVEQRLEVKPLAGLSGHDTKISQERLQHYEALLARQLAILTPAFFWTWFFPGSELWPGMPAVSIAGTDCTIRYFDGGPGGWVLSVQRGFVAAVEMTAGDWLEHDDAMMARWPVQQATLFQWERSFPGLEESQQLCMKWPGVAFTFSEPALGRLTWPPRDTGRLIGGVGGARLDTSSISG